MQQRKMMGGAYSTLQYNFDLFDPKFTVDFYSAQEKLDMLKLCERIKKEFLADEYDMRIIRTDDERMVKSQ